ncbi:hypothetical protein T10_8841 [Trichinella papuae]|uniref:Uncharacterized protein n=1 Tax=Trichinella papuae TaxID=268474 RepID=A0A0V1M417_9BILA|nr:hypothetical protein T10_8841 [Trichinella papuae]
MFRHNIKYSNFVSLLKNNLICINNCVYSSEKGENTPKYCFLSDGLYSSNDMIAGKFTTNY